MARLANKIALITGAAKGIGRETARRFMEEGAIVILSDVLNDVGQQAADELGDNAYYYHLDVTSEQKWQAIMAYIEQEFGQLNILFNNAGILHADNVTPGDPEHEALANWDKIHLVNLDSVFLGCKYGIQLMKKSKQSSIVNMSSRSCMVGIPDCAAYSSSKAAIRNYSKTVALYCAREGYDIRCNSIHPAAVLTDIWKVSDDQAGKEKVAKIAAGIPMHRMGEPVEVADMVLFLASDESSYVTGAEFVIDGGVLAGAASAPK